MQVDVRDVAMAGLAVVALLLAIVFIVTIWSAALGAPLF